MNATIEKFGYPATLVADYRHWVVLLRPAQPTLGSLILAAKSEATAFSNLAAEAFAELAAVTADLEQALGAKVDYAKLNYLMLMMVDPHVHFHVIPRYDGMRSAEGVAVADAGWPNTPALNEGLTLDPEQTARLVAWLCSGWPSPAG